jgi:chemotaxis protein MotB
MPRIRKPHEAENHDRWLVSYADFITLLFAFFVVMFAASQTDKGKAQQVSDSVKRALDGPVLSSAIAAFLGGAPNDKGQGNAQMHGPGGYKEQKKTSDRIVELLPSLKVLSRELKDEIAKGSIQVSMGARGLTISFRQAALFPSGGDEIAPETYPSIQKVANAIRQLPNPVRLEGHTDSLPIHNLRFKSNWELSAARSIALLTMMTDDYGVSRERISIAGYADTTPVASNETDDGRAKNRRVDVVILNETGLQGEPERIPK